MTTISKIDAFYNAEELLGLTQHDTEHKRVVALKFSLSYAALSKERVRCTLNNLSDKRIIAEAEAKNLLRAP